MYNDIVMDIGNWNCQIPLSMTTTIEFKIFKLLIVSLEYFITQLPLSIIEVLRTILVIILVSKLI